MANITRFLSDIYSGVNPKTGLGGGIPSQPIGTGGGAGYYWYPITKVVAQASDPNPLVFPVTSNDTIIEVDASAQNVQVVLPNATQSNGQGKIIKRVDSSFNAANTVTIVDAAGNNVEGAASQTLNALNAIFQAQSDGTSWQCMGGSNSAAWGHVQAIANVAPGASPYTYTASAAGSVVITGGTVSAIQLKRGSTTITVAAASPAVVPVSAGDQVITTYSAAPTMSFVPR